MMAVDCPDASRHLRKTAGITKTASSILFYGHYIDNYAILNDLMNWSDAINNVFFIALLPLQMMQLSKVLATDALLSLTAISIQ
jgi:hypothetical protein